MLELVTTILKILPTYSRLESHYILFKGKLAGLEFESKGVVIFYINILVLYLAVPLHWLACLMIFTST